MLRLCECNSDLHFLQVGQPAAWGGGGLRSFLSLSAADGRLRTNDIIIN